MEAKQLIKLIEEEFYTRIEQKNGWGKKEIKQTFLDSLNKVLLDNFPLTEAKSKR